MAIIHSSTELPAKVDAEKNFTSRVAAHKAEAFAALAELYGGREDLAAIQTNLIERVTDTFRARPQDLKTLDATCEMTSRDWYRRQNMVGYTCYVDRFAGSLQGVIEKIPYLKSLGVTYLHLLSVLRARPGDSDGGFAVADYRQTNSGIGTIDDLEALTRALRQNGIGLCLDFAFNHTAREHEWAQKAIAGDKRFRDYYFIFEWDEALAQYQPYLEEVFPVAAPGNFTFDTSLSAWVWTTFYPFQWDLNYRNPNVFAGMLNYLLDLANKGVQIFRMDAAAFTWKQAGSNCLNLPQTHALLRAFRALVAMVAPSVILKVEAIVGARQAALYFGTGEHRGREGHIAYHNALMASLWRSLATEDAGKTRQLLSEMPVNPEGTAWVNYLRCHDDIGWGALLDEQGAGWASSVEELQQLADFYDAGSTSSYPRGRHFQTQAGHEVHGTNGTLASLAGLEQALCDGNAEQAKLAVRRITMLYSVLFAQSGIPLINMGDECGMLNDYSHVEQPTTSDGRWLHRPFFKVPDTEPHSSCAQQVFSALRQLVKVRTSHNAFHSQASVSYPVPDHGSVLATLRRYREQTVLTVANFSGETRAVRVRGRQHGLDNAQLVSLLTSPGAGPGAGSDIVQLPPYGYGWFLVNYQ
ncbi:alpha-amylase family glycosyl hydrolase [Sedimenticola sp.]|uniref:alpha-amylase family glycosyl hydrolase n=1 Tax=Sedimenticola sp. TaxID=1940285 RepID=UPI003D0C3500